MSEPLFHLVVEGVDVDWAVRGVTGSDAMGRPSSFFVVGSPVVDDGTPTGPLADAVLAQPATLRWHVGDAERTLHAIVDAVEARPGGFTLALVSRIAILDESIDHRVFVDVDVIAISQAILGEHGFSIDVRATRTPPARSQCVQAFESDLAFVTRILAEEGIVWLLDHEVADSVILADTSFPDAPLDPLPVRSDAGLGTSVAVHAVHLTRGVAPEALALRDYDFKVPMVDLASSASTGRAQLERYEYPGGFTQQATGDTLAKIRLEEARTGSTALQAETNAGGLVPGQVVRLDGGAADGRWLITEVTHDGSEEARASAVAWRYTAKVKAVPAGGGYRPARSRRPKLGGVQTATVMGPSGSEIHTEEHGRVKVSFRWDRRAPTDDKASTWVRVIQPATSGGFFLPRVGWEELVGFWGTSGDVPIAMGRLYNGQSTPPNVLPKEKVMSAFGTATTPGRGAGNRVAMNDAAGSEAMHFNASNDYNERTESDKVTTVTGDDTWTIGGSRKLIVGQVLAQKIDGAQSYTVTAKREVNVTANKVIGVGGAETVAVGGVRMFDIGGDQTTNCASLRRLVGAAKAEAAIEHQSRVVTGASAVRVGGSWNVTAGLHASVNVGGASFENVSGAKSIKTPTYELSALTSYTEDYASLSLHAGGDVLNDFKTTGRVQIGASATVGGSYVMVAASNRITLKAGGVTIKITPGEVKIEGKFDGDVGSVEADKGSHG